MSQKGLSNFFEKYLEDNKIFKNRNILQSSYIPENVLHRDNQINTIASVLAPSLKGSKPSNIFLYGNPGTGKTLCIKYVSRQMQEIIDKKQLPVKILYLNCKMKRIADTEYRLIAQILKEMGQDIPATGLPTDEVYNIFYNLLSKGNDKILILILDEIDQLINKAGDEIIYNLIRLNSEINNVQLSLVGISNNAAFTEAMDPRVKSSLSEEDVLFTPYNALQIKDILKNRAENAFFENVLETGLIEKCAAIAAREHGDARRALELLRVAGEIAERKGLSKVRLDHLDEAEEKIEKDKILDIVKAQPKQTKVALYSILYLFDSFSNNSNNNQNKVIYTGDIYEIYRKICMKTDLRPLTLRRISDIIGELDILGIITASIVFRGRNGKTREIKPIMNPTLKQRILDILKEELEL
ncbi:MAG: orc1/cdc6 family replication initiation protein [Candidatus Woesearchaeota archaeon]